MPVPTYKIQLTKLITNQLIVGNTHKSGDSVVVLNPYEAVVTQEGLQLIPLDEHILGVRLKELILPQGIVVYTNKVSRNLIGAYLEALTGIKIPKKELIL